MTGWHHYHSHFTGGKAEGWPHSWALVPRPILELGGIQSRVWKGQIPTTHPYQPKLQNNSNPQSVGCLGVVSISDSLSAVAGRSARGSLSGWDGGQGRVSGPLAWPVPVLASSFLRRLPSPASGALFSCPPGPPPRPTCFEFETRFSPLLPLCSVPPARSPVPPSAASCLRSSRYPDPQECHRGVRRAPSPHWLQPPPPPAGWPLSHRFQGSRLRFPAPLPSLPSLILVTVQLAQGTAAKRALSPASTSAPSFQPSCLGHPSGHRGLVAPIPVLGGVGIMLLVGCRWPLPAHPDCVGSPLFDGWVCLSYTTWAYPSALSTYCCPNLHRLLGKLQAPTDLSSLPPWTSLGLSLGSLCCSHHLQDVDLGLQA